MAEPLEWASERRRAPRIDLLADVQGHLVTLDEKVQVRQLSLGGMIVESSAPLSVRLFHDFRITFASGVVTVHGRVAHNRVVVQDDAVTYLAGIEFVAPSPEALGAIEGFLREAEPA